MKTENVEKKLKELKEQIEKLEAEKCEDVTKHWYVCELYNTSYEEYSYALLGNIPESKADEWVANLNSGDICTLYDMEHDEYSIYYEWYHLFQAKNSISYCYQCMERQKVMLMMNALNEGIRSAQKKVGLKKCNVNMYIYDDAQW